VAGDAPSAASRELDLVQRAVSRRCRVHLTYKGSRRVVEPLGVHSGPSGWYLSGRETGSEVVKEFVVSRMSGVELEAPGTSSSTPDGPVRRSLDPLTWEVDPPTEVVLEVPAQHRVLAENLLGTPRSTEAADGAVTLGYLVTNRRVFRYRIYELGTRVRIVGPDDVRAELLAELRGFLGAGS
jgi:predicted DNA-binding transcriptional regulator YafY